MTTESKKNKSFSMMIIALLLVIGLLIIGFVGALSLGVITIGEEENTIIKYSQNSKGVNATVIIDFGDGSIISKEITSKNNTVYGFLMELGGLEDFNVKATYYGQFDSLFVDSIAGYAGGQDNYYWIYYVNEISGYVGADKQIVNDGDIIDWKYEESIY